MNLIIIGHLDSGKSTLTENILLRAKKLREESKRVEAIEKGEKFFKTKTR